MTSSLPVHYPPETVLTAEQAAGMLQVSMATFDRMDVPCAYLIGRTEGRKRRSMRRYIAGDMLEFVRQRRKSA